MPNFNIANMHWQNLGTINNRNFTCGFCGIHVSSTIGVYLLAPPNNHHSGSIHVCPNCIAPNFFPPGNAQFPSPALGKPVDHVPVQLNTLYDEARRCTSDNCYTAAVLLCRKMLMNIAVEQGAEEGKAFIEYVKYLSDQGFVPPNGKHWVDHIRKKGNEATHEIALMGESDARDILIFVEMLLKFIYEFPKLVPEASA